MAEATRLTGLRAATIFLLAAMAVPALATAPALAEPGAASDSEAVTSTWSALDAAWNARDAKAFSLLFSEDVSFEFVRRGQSLDGRAAVFEQFAERFPTFSPELRHRTRVRQVIAIARAAWESC